MLSLTLYSQGRRSPWALVYLEHIRSPRSSAEVPRRGRLIEYDLSVYSLVCACM